MPQPFAAVLALLATVLATAPLVASEGPDPCQRALLERGYGMFCHFGLNTFHQKEWSDGTLPAASFNPTALDCDQWVRTAKEAGFRHIVLVTKHHDGFCLWDSVATDYDVGSAPVKTDIVGEVAKACKKYDVALGLYYSLWDRHEPTHREKDPTAYIAFMKRQLTELLTNYGPIVELWFDGGWAKPDADWRIPEVYRPIKDLQPNCAVTVNHTIGIPGGKPGAFRNPEDLREGDPIRFWPVDFRTKDPNLQRADDPKRYLGPDGRLHWLPFEHTICISDRWNWFQKKDATPARSPDELEEMYYWCTAGSALLVNLPPDQTGRLRENERQAILATADLLGIRGGRTPLPAPPVNQALGAKAEADSVWDDEHGPAAAIDASLEWTRWAAKATPATLTLTPAQPFVFDRVALHEFSENKGLGDGFSTLRLFRTREWVLEARRGEGWDAIAMGTTLGVKVLRFAEPITADGLRLRILATEGGPASIYHVSVSDSRTRRPRSLPY